jgi:peptide/nickel transport system substrate-binding protein
LFQLEGFPGYWRGGPAEKSAEFLIIPGADEAVRLLEKNQVDIVCNLPSQLVDRVEANLKLWVESRLSESVVYLQLNHRVPPFDDPRIRQAIDLALDREELVREVSLNYARPASQMLGPDIFGHDPDLTPPKRDLVAARRLIKEAGYAAGPNLSIEITEAYELYAAVLARQLDEAGFQTSVKIRPWPELYADLRAGTVGIWFGLWAFDSSEAGLFFEALAHTPTSDGSFGAGNFSRYSDPDLDRAIQEAVAELDLPKRKEKLQEISRRFTQIRGLLPILWPLDLYGMRRDLDWEAREDGRILFFDMKRRASEDE